VEAVGGVVARQAARHRLHSHGSAPGILRKLFTFYGIESVVWLLKPAVRRLRLSH
jgi:hypothetical protein